jgi:hypothetical protein
VTNPCWVANPVTCYPDETLWLYGEWDPFYPLAHSPEDLAAFQAAGGEGVLDRAAAVGAYLARRGLPNVR